MSERRSDRWVSVLMSVLVHGAVIGLLGWGWWFFRRPAPAAQQLAIEARVIDAATLARLTAPPSPAPEPAPQPVPAPPPPDAAQLAAEQRAEQEKQAQQEERERQEEQAQQQRQVQRERAEQQKAEQAKAERERARRAEQERQAARAKAEAERKASEVAAKEAREQKERQQTEVERKRRESELRAQLATEERTNAARGSAQQAEYKALIEARINRAWIRPTTARAGIDCEVRVTQVPGGEVVGVQVTKCNGDAAVRESIEAAVYRASPLPLPPNPDLFDRNLVVNFTPND